MPLNTGLRDKVVIVTGAAAGIGRTTALRFAREGAQVAAWDVTDREADALTAQLLAAGAPAARFQRVDVSRRDQVEAAVADIASSWGRIDVLVNNAGILRDAQLVKWKDGEIASTMTDEQFDAVIAVNLKGVFVCTRAVVPHMIRERGGVILNASSVVGLYGNFGQTNYAATKAAVINMTKTWARELGRYNIRVNAVAPGFIATEMVQAMPQKVLDSMVAQTPIGRMGQPDDIARRLRLARFGRRELRPRHRALGRRRHRHGNLRKPCTRKSRQPAATCPSARSPTTCFGSASSRSSPSSSTRWRPPAASGRAGTRPRIGRRPTSRCAPRRAPSRRRGRSRRRSISSSSAPTRPTTSPRRLPSSSSTSSAPPGAGTFDVGCACASFPTGLAAAAGIMATNKAIRTVLVVGVYMMHKLSAPNDPMIFFYGDGAGAAILERSEIPGFLGAAFQADGRYAKHWGIYAGATAEPASEEAVRAGRTTVKMIERYPPEINDEGWAKLVRKLASENGFAISEIDFLVFTQVRKPTIELVMSNLGLPMSKTHTIMEKWGYTGSACIPMALDDAIEQKKIRHGDLVVMVGSGVGYNQAAAAIRM